MAVTTAMLNALMDDGNPVTHIALFDDGGTEITGGSPAYARQAVTWTAASNGSVSPTADLTFDIPASTTVAEWRGYDHLSAGTNYGGATLTQETYAAQGEYRLLASETAYDIDAV